MYKQVEKSGKSKNKTVTHSIAQKIANREGRKLKAAPDSGNCRDAVPCTYPHTTKNIIQMNDGWTTVGKGKQKSDKTAVEAKMIKILTDHHWEERKETYYLPLNYSVRLGNQIAQSHMTITKKDIKIASTNNKQHFQDPEKIEAATKALSYHITIETSDDFVDNDKPHFYSDWRGWVNADEVSNTDKAKLEAIAADKMNSL